MCGIVGLVLHYQGGLIQQTENSFYEMLYADAIRGWDSTGMIMVEKDGAFHIAKEAIQATHFIPAVKHGTVGRKMWNDGKVLIGHNRKKTVGDIKDETAHPFVVEDTFAMVHNGTLYGHKDLANVDVDSEALAIVLKKALEQENWKEELELTLGRVWGAYAVAIYDQKKEKVHLLRNKERPLSILKADNATFFASEAGLAMWIIGRNGYDLSKVEVKEVPVDVLMTYDIGSNKWSEEKLVPKKSTPKQTVVMGMSSVGGNITTGTIKIAKNALKFFRKKYVGSRISFWAEDFVEENCPKTIEDGETEVILFGICEDIKYLHSLTAKVDLAKFNMRTKDDIFDYRWTGIIEDFEFNEATQSACLTIGDCKPVVKSLDQEKLHKVFEESLMSKPISQLRQEFYEYFDHLAEWQKNTYSKVLASKVSKLQDLESSMREAGLEAVLEEAKAKGRTIVNEVRNGKTVYFDDDTEEVVYEMPVTVH